MDVPVNRVVRSAARDLAAAGIESARAEADLICSQILGVDRSRLLLADPPDATAIARIEYVVASRCRDRAPLQYLLGRAVSGRLDLAVGPGVFIPRPETELLVADVLAALPEPAVGVTPVVVDLCAGSGTLALEIAHARPDVRVHAVELEESALFWLRRNSSERAAAGDPPIEVHAGDATDPNLLTAWHRQVTAVVSNPPYIPATHVLPREVDEFEPHSALFGGGDGLAVIRPLVSVAALLLAPGGHLVVEHDDSTSNSVAAVVSNHGGFGTVERHTDLAGRPRFVTATRLDDEDGDDVSTGEKGTAR